VNKIFAVIAGAAGIVQILSSGASADVAYLANGRQMECIVKIESNDYVEFEVEIGTIRLRRPEISRIERFSPDENADMIEEWRKRKAKAEVARKAWQEAEKVRLEEELKRQELLPKKVDIKHENGHMIASAKINKTLSVNLLVDTGASLVVLSRPAGEKLGLVTAADTPENKKIDRVQLQVADGRKIQAKYVLLDSVLVQDAEAKKVEAAVLLDDKAEILYDGVLGMSYLKQFNVNFNNKSNKLILEKLQ
jgi:clan AA aspartic protease (TIGR02281 family)